MKKYIYAGFLALVLILTSSHSFAKFTITPGIDVRGEYNDNIFLEKSDTDDDYITTLRPNIMLEYTPNSSLDLSLDFGADLKYYSSYNNLNDKTPRAEMSASARPFRRVFIDVTDIYTRVPIDIRNQFALENTLTNMTDSNSFLLSTSVVLPVTTAVSTTAGYNYHNQWFQDAGNTGSETHSIFVLLNARYSSKMNRSLKYSYSAYRPDLSGRQDAVVEYNKNAVSAVLEYQIASNFEVNGELGGSLTDYSTRNNSEMFFGNFGADYTFKFISGASLGINYSRSLRDSPTSGAARSHRGDLFFRVDNILKLTVNPYFIDDTFVNAARKDKIEGINVNVSRPMGSKTTLLLNGSLEKQRFMPEGEKVGRYSLGCSLDYKLSSKITTGIGYRYSGRKSNIDTEEFNNNIGWLQARVSF